MMSRTRRSLLTAQVVDPDHDAWARFIDKRRWDYHALHVLSVTAGTRELTPGGVVRTTVTRTARDRAMRVLASLSRMTERRRGTTTALLTWGSHSKYQDGVLVGQSDFSQDDVAQALTRLRTDVPARDANDQVVGMHTRLQNNPGTARPRSFDEAVVGLASPDYDDLAVFKRDPNGRLIEDDRFEYWYDHRGHLTRVEDRYPYARDGSPTWYVRYVHDGLGRCVLQRPHPDRWRTRAESVGDGYFTELRFVYDGPRLVAEVFGKTSTTLATYAYGEGDELISMDRRVRDEARGQLRRFLFVPEPDGTIDHALTDVGARAELTSVDRGVLDGVGWISGFDTRMPYLATGLRRQPFHGRSLDERVSHSHEDLRSAHELVWRMELDDWLSEVRRRRDDLVRPALALMAAGVFLPIAPGAFITSGLINLGTSAAFRAIMGSSYSPLEAFQDFVLGGVSGSVGGLVSKVFTASRVIATAASVAADIAVDSALDVIFYDQDPLESVLQNTLSNTIGGAIGFGVSRAAKQARAARRAKNEAFRARALDPQHAVGYTVRERRALERWAAELSARPPPAPAALKWDVAARGRSVKAVRTIGVASIDELKKLGTVRRVANYLERNVVELVTPCGGRHLFVRPSYGSYRKAMKKWVGSRFSLDDFDVDHLLSRKRGAAMGLGYVRLEAISPPVNRSFGSVEKVLGAMHLQQGVHPTRISLDAAAAAKLTGLRSSKRNLQPIDWAIPYTP
ncbi:MAG: hypothetical protein R3B70_30455 [Polyangiaceae bacterium]